MTLSLIAAVAENNVIGANGKLPWHIPDDLKQFKKITSGHSLVMGRKTFESLPKVLPGRRHYVITRNADYKNSNPMASGSDNVFVVPDPGGALMKIREDMAKNPKIPQEVFVIGGGEIYEKMLPQCDKIYLTHVKRKVEGEVFFPKLNHSEWKEEERLNFPEYDFAVYARKNP